MFLSHILQYIPDDKRDKNNSLFPMRILKKLRFILKSTLGKSLNFIIIKTFTTFKTYNIKQCAMKLTSLAVENLT